MLWDLIKLLKILINIFLIQLQTALIYVHYFLYILISITVKVKIIINLFFLFWKQEFQKLLNICHSLNFFVILFFQNFLSLISAFWTVVFVLHVFHKISYLIDTFFLLTFNMGPSRTILTITANPLKVFSIWVFIRENLAAKNTYPTFVNRGLASHAIFIVCVFGIIMLIKSTVLIYTLKIKFIILMWLGIFKFLNFHYNKNKFIKLWKFSNKDINYYYILIHCHSIARFIKSFSLFFFYKFWFII